MKTILLNVVSQEGQLLKTTVSRVTAPTKNGEITILPDHIALFTKLETGQLVYEIDKKEAYIVVSQGFLTVSPEGEITVMVDSATLDRDISLAKAEAAVKAAQETITKTADQRELLMAEASLKRALLEIRVAQRSKKTGI